jgi:FkbM family methyltransferase
MKKNSLLFNSISKVRYHKWTYREAFAYFVRGFTRETKICPAFFENLFNTVRTEQFKKRWFDNEQKCFNFNGALIPDVSANEQLMSCLKGVFEDTFLFLCILDDNYDKSLVELMDDYMTEGPYGYVTDNFDVRVKPNDVVIDAGAWIGDFSAYSASKGAVSYAFEPVDDTYLWLKKTAELNKGIIAVKKGLSSFNGKVKISMDEVNSEASSIVLNRNKDGEEIEVTTLDSFVEENNISRIDFIKSDIEGAERDMLRGATKVLQKFAPKLAICTYHLPDDPQVLEQIIKEANPDYRVVHISKKLFATIRK